MRARVLSHVISVDQLEHSIYYLKPQPSKAALAVAAYLS